MRCSRCNSENPEGKKFCGDCGAEITPRTEPVSVPGDPGAYFCARHKKEPTRVTCGRCDTPVCTRCAVPGPVGIRCRECAKNRIGFRPMGALHEAGRRMDSPAGRAVWYVAIWIAVVAIFRNLFGGGGES